MWPFVDKQKQEAPAEPALPADQNDDLGMVRLNSLAVSINDAIAKHLDPSHMGALDDTGGHYDTEFNLFSTVGRLKSLYRREPWVYATASLIARTLANVPLVVRDSDTGEINEEHELNSILQAGNKLVDAHTMGWAGDLDLCLSGNEFLVITKDRKSVYQAPVEFTELDINYGWKPGDKSDPINNLRITGSNGYGKAVAETIPWDQVIHLKLPNPYTPYYGMSMFQAAARPILLDRHKNEFEMAFYLRGATQAGVIETDEDLTKRRSERLQSTFEQAYTGKRNWWRTLFLPKGAKWVTNGLTMREMEHLEGLRENRRTLLATLGVPPTMVGIVEDVNRATAEVQEEAFWQNTIIPLARFKASGWNHSYLVQKTYGGQVYVEPNFSGIAAVQGGLVRKGEEIKAVEDIMLVSEARMEAGLPPLKESDPRGKLFVSQIKRVAVDLASLSDPAYGIDDTELAQSPTRQITIPVGGDPLHGHDGLIDDAGNGTTSSTSEGPDHTHELRGMVQADGRILVQTLEGGENEHVHPDTLIDTSKALSIKAIKVAKADAVRDQDRLERRQSQKYSKVLDAYADMIVAVAVRDLKDNKNPASSLAFTQPERLALYREKGLPILAETMDRSFTLAVSNSKFFTQAMQKAPRFTPTDEQAIEVIKERKRPEYLSNLERRGIEAFYGFDENATEHVMQIIEQGARDGKTFQEIAKDIERDDAGYKESYKDQFFTIVRTETLTAVSQGYEWEGDTLEEVFSEVVKQWFHVGDVGLNPDARSHHLDFEKEGKKPRSHTYVSTKTGTSLKYPRDPSGGASEVINCRCSLVNTVADGATSNAVAILEGG